MVSFYTSEERTRPLVSVAWLFHKIYFGDNVSSELERAWPGANILRAGDDKLHFAQLR